MNKTGIVIILLCFLAAAAVVLWERRKARKTMEEIERMLDAAMTGSFSETNFDESQLSALETEEMWFANWDMGGAYWEKQMT